MGMRHLLSGSAQVDSSTLSGIGAGAGSWGVDGIFGGTRITNTRIVGGVLNDVTGTQCRNTYDAALNDVSC